MKKKYLGVFALTFSAAFAQPVEIRFDNGRQDRAAAVVTDASANMYLAGAVEDSSKPSTFAVLKYSPSGTRLWTAHLQALANEFSGTASDVAVDAAGNTYAAGNILRRVGTFTTNTDWVVASFSPSGAQRWAHRITGPEGSLDSARQIVLSSSGDLYVSGTSGVNHADWLVVKYSASGTVLWQTQLAGAGNSADQPIEMVLDPVGNLVVAGLTVNIPLTDRNDITVAKFTSDGTLMWRRDFTDGEFGDDVTGGMAVDIGGNVYVSGTTTLGPEMAVEALLIKWDSLGNLVFVKKGGAHAGGGAVLVDGAGDVVTSGERFEPLAATGNAAVSKLDSDGNLKWSTLVQGSSILTTDFQRNIYVAGTVLNADADQADFFGGKLSPLGAVLWQHRHTDGLRVGGATLDALGQWIVAGGSATGPSSFLQDILVLKFPSNFSTPAPSGPTAPSNLTARAAARQIQLAWNDLSDNEQGFRIERCEGRSCSNFVQIAQTAANVRSFVDAGLGRRTDYTYRVRSFNASGVSAASNSASARTGN
ncbi:MAG TPA: hypothetical protein VER03_25195 [Bryobacteraceae bacterium]|nr:hypothetical protein [Bryobacteraceae bacterium]